MGDGPSGNEPRVTGYDARLARHYSEMLRTLADAIAAGEVEVLGGDIALAIGEYTEGGCIARTPTGVRYLAIMTVDHVVAERWAAICAAHPEAVAIPAAPPWWTGGDEDDSEGEE